MDYADFLGKNDFAVPATIVSDFTEGACWRLAQALHQQTGWTIVTCSMEEDTAAWCHAAVKTPAGTIVDIKGEWDAETWLDEWACNLGADAVIAEWGDDFESLCINKWEMTATSSESPEKWAGIVVASLSPVV